MSLYLSSILSHCVSVSLIASDSLWVFLCVLLLFHYLSHHSLSLCNSNFFFVSTIARLQSVRCANAFELHQFFSLILILHHFPSFPLSFTLSLTFSSLRSLSLCNSNFFLVSTIARLQSVRCPDAFELHQFFSLILILFLSFSVSISVFLFLILNITLSTSLYFFFHHPLYLHPSLVCSFLFFFLLPSYPFFFI